MLIKGMQQQQQQQQQHASSRGKTKTKTKGVSLLQGEGFIYLLTLSRRKKPSRQGNRSDPRGRLGQSQRRGCGGWLQLLHPNRFEFHSEHGIGAAAAAATTTGRVAVVAVAFIDSDVETHRET